MSDLGGRCGTCGREMTTGGCYYCGGRAITYPVTFATPCANRSTLERELAEARKEVGKWRTDFDVARADVAALRDENHDLRSLLKEARSHNPERYRSSSDDSGTHGAVVGASSAPSSDWTRVAPSGEGSGQPTIREGWCPHCGTTRIEDYSDGVSDVCRHTSDANVVRLAFREGFNMSDGARAEHALTGKTITVDAAWAASEAKASLKGMGAEGAMSDMTLQAHDDGYEQGRLAAFGVIRKAAQTVIDQRKPRAFEPHDDGRRSFAFDVLELCDDALGARREP